MAYQVAGVNMEKFNISKDLKEINLILIFLKIVVWKKCILIFLFLSAFFKT